jgi:DNA excision repair protein ERCC-2
MAQPYDRAGNGGKKTLLTEEDLQNMAQDSMEM